MYELGNGHVEKGCELTIVGSNQCLAKGMLPCAEILDVHLIKLVDN